MPPTVEALWSDAEQEYQASIGGVPLWSADGDYWMPADAQTHLPPGFEAARITLRGGPRDGETVS